MVRCMAVIMALSACSPPVHADHAGSIGCCYPHTAVRCHQEVSIDDGLKKNTKVRLLEHMVNYLVVISLAINHLVIDPSIRRGFNHQIAIFNEYTMLVTFRTLRARVLGVVVLAIALTSCAGAWVIYDRTYELVTGALHEKMRSMLVQAESTTDSMSALVQGQAFDYERLTAELEAKGRSNYRDTIFYQTVPVVASWTAIRKSIEGSAITFRIVRENPRNLDNAPANAFERRILEAESSTKCNTDLLN